MKLSDELFLRYVPIEDLLIKYGFKKDNNLYFYSKKIHNDELELRFNVINKRVYTKLIDTIFDDEFVQINVEGAKGDFLNAIKQECTEILIDIRDKCFKKEYFAFSQSNRVSELVYQRYGVVPEFLWDDLPNAGVFRNKSNPKWFGIVMMISKNKITGDSDEKIEVINLKLDDKVGEYLKIDGVYPAYHMNKKNWVSVFLNDTLSDEDVMELIEISIINSSKKERKN